MLSVAILIEWEWTLTSAEKKKNKKKTKEVKSLLVNVGSSFSYETGINGCRRCALYSHLLLSVLRFTGIQSYGYTDQRKVETDVRSLKIEPETSRSESRALANWATTAPQQKENKNKTKKIERMKCKRSAGLGEQTTREALRLSFDNIFILRAQNSYSIFILCIWVYLDWKRSSGWLESWEGLLLVTD